MGIAAESLRRWTSIAEPTTTALVPIEVVEESRTSRDADRRLRLVTSAGHRIEGLSLADVIEVVRVLG